MIVGTNIYATALCFLVPLFRIRYTIGIGGHGSWVKGGVYTLGVSEKNFVAASEAN